MGPSAVGPADGVRVRVAYVCLTLAAVILAVGVAAPGPRRVNIRWTDSATPADRVAAELTLGLRHPRALETATWSYEVADAAVIQRILQQPLIEDTHYIDRERRTFSEELPRPRARLRQLYETRLLAALAMHWELLSGILVIIALAFAWPAVQTTYRSSPDRVWLVIILGVSLVARIVLVLAGGQYYWPDEGRYTEGQRMVEQLTAGDVQGAWGSALASGHPLFKTVSMVPAVIEATHGRDPRIPATFFALFSVINVWLLARIARRLDATPTEAAWVAFLSASSTSLLFYARHLFPYDLAMMFGLLALYAGLTPQGSGRASILCGIWAGCAFLTYYGAWTLGGAACAIHVFNGSSLENAGRRGVLAGAGLTVTILGALVISEFSGEDFFLRLREFSMMVSQGSFAEGWRLPLEYLWHAERLLLVFWLSAVTACLVTWNRWRHVRTVRTGLIGFACLYGALAALSTGMHLLVVYGRLARQLVPFCCLVAAPVAVRFAGRDPRLQRPILSALAAAVISSAAFNAWPVFSQRFPPEFVADGQQTAGRQGASRAVAIYAEHLYPAAKVDLPSGYAEVISARHPLQFLPYQYEGFSPEERQVLRTTDIRMRMLVPAADTR